jgi:hypothetical protein
LLSPSVMKYADVVLNTIQTVIKYLIGCASYIRYATNILTFALVLLQTKSNEV